ncbi:GNAT family N-acetyltransferase [Pseudobutyrivibrio xylanivorans]|uniref:GNAT family N-acetyltransferase n=1 Tax=Pseudobutyrivibrio xylanivorans TaxID=185007 RepID=A0A5P6VTB2_PSEXY|nr:GNAT family N-acetyltransferase [Pseudobutyrivibrio xylanivorans]QFJ54989.1 GNAT family N-acetyltransferase [Pseudobutyrivibrio xylanivorans]
MLFNIGEKVMREIVFDSDNLIYNRLDLIYIDDVNDTYIIHEGIKYKFQYHIDGAVAEINVWGKYFPQSVFEKFIETIFDAEKNISSIDVRSALNDYHNQLILHGDMMIRLPSSSDELLNRLGSKGKHTLKRKRRILKECFKEFCIKNVDKIEPSDVETYFLWKKCTHGTEYNLSPDEYLKKYHVTNAIKLLGDNELVAILFYCKYKDVVYFENFSYNTEYKKCSPGFLVYSYFLEEMTNDGVKYVFLGKSGLDYKRRFYAEERNCYSGKIYRDSFFDSVKTFFDTNRVKNIVIYGFGVCGKEFLQANKHIGVNIICAIDRALNGDGSVKVISPDDVWPNVDAIIVTMNSYNKDIENILDKKGTKYFYWIDIKQKVLEKMGEKYEENTTS